MLNVVYDECHILLGAVMLVVIHAKQFHAECHILLSAVMLVVIYARQLHAEYCLC
jgi:hypothetical protein